MAAILLVNKASLRFPGGAEVRIREVATRWARAGHQVYLLCGKTAPEEPARWVHEGVVVRCLRVLPDALLRRFPVPHYLPQALFYLVAAPAVLYYLRRWRIDAIRDSMSPVPALGPLAPLLGGRGIVVLHILFGDYRGWRRYYPALYAWAGALAERLLLRGWLRYRAVVTDAPWVAQRIRQHGCPGLRVEAVENGVDTRCFARRPPRGRVRRLVTAARLVEHKGHLELIEACRRLRDLGAAFELHLLGDGPLAGLIRERIAQHGLDGCVHLRPALARAELQRRLADFDCYVMPSRSEGLPVILLEAMAAGLPVVVAARPYATTLVDASVARLYDPGDPEGLARAIGWALDHPAEAEAQAERARAWVERFSWARAAERELALLGLGPASGPPP